MKEIVVTGYRATGKLHLGNLLGNILNMIDLQEKYRCFYFFANLHALTTDYKDTSEIMNDVKIQLAEFLALGINPDKTVLYLQSDIPEITELTLYFSMFTPISRMQRNPTFKEQMEELSNKDLRMMGFLAYPILMASDIIIVHADYVPVGDDQLPHIEITREIARKFNKLYGDYFKEPQALVTKASRVPGIDGRKMSKSYGNAIYLSDEPDVIKKKVAMMITDPKRVYVTDKGHPEVCDVFYLHKSFSKEEINEIKKKCKNAHIGCTQCKDELAKKISNYLYNFRKKRADYLNNPDYLRKVLKNGKKIVREIARETIKQVRHRMKLNMF
jgi:tryptophanyl-tRNA synthetase